jgi:Histidine kinase-, DNA gyrase B-, and HSP90-like ATPase
MKLDITGASHWTRRMYEACGPFQWAREFLKNAIEANATRVHFGIEWQAVEKLGVYRRAVADNGAGMSADELLRFFSKLGEGAKKIGGVHDNFGVGGKIAALPWNPQGLVMLSRKGGRTSMIWIILDSDSGDYELREFETDEKRTCVIDPTAIEWPEDGVDWGSVIDALDWASAPAPGFDDHGTVAVLLGSQEQPDTILGNPEAGEGDIKGLSVYLNTRFWGLSGARVTVAELRSEKKSQWPAGPEDRDDSRRPNNREMKGAGYYVSEISSASGKLGGAGTVELDQSRVRADWYLWEGDRPAIHSYAKKGGYVAVRYGDELFELTSHKAHFRWFGVIEATVQQKLTIILRPQLYVPSNGRWGIHPDQSRNRLIFTGNGEKGVSLPLQDWGAEFAEKMPDEIRAAIVAARGDLAGSIEDEEYRKRLQDKFGTRWQIKTLVRASKKDKGTQVEATITDEDMEVIPQPPIIEHPRIRRPRRPSNKDKTVVVVRKKATLGGTMNAIEMAHPVDVPHFRLAHKDDFEQPWHLAAWNPHDPEGPTVYINVDSPILEEVVQYHQHQYPDVHAEEVAKVVWNVFGEVAACKIAHSQKLTKEVTEEELDRSYRSEEALTTALMGLLAEESLIAQRCGKFGPKKAVA